MNKQNGFSLIELLIVVVVIAIIAAIAIPNLLAARKSANEGSAVSSLRTLYGANVTYSSTTGGGDFALAIADLGTSNLIDPALATSFKSGYDFTDYARRARDPINGIPATFALVARPSVVTGITATGTRNFGISTDGVIGTEPLDGTSAGTMDAVVGANACTFGSGYPVVGNL